MKHVSENHNINRRAAMTLLETVDAETSCQVFNCSRKPQAFQHTSVSKGKSSKTMDPLLLKPALSSLQMYFHDIRSPTRAIGEMCLERKVCSCVVTGPL